MALANWCIDGGVAVGEGRGGADEVPGSKQYASKCTLGVVGLQGQQCNSLTCKRSKRSGINDAIADLCREVG